VDFIPKDDELESSLGKMRKNNLFAIGFSLLFGIIFGLASAFYLINTQNISTAFQFQGWQSWSAETGSSLNPYSWAALGMRGEIPFDTSTNIEFRASVDRDGNPLKAQCSYQITGEIPQSRLWTLVSVETNQANQLDYSNQTYISSRQIQFSADNSILLAVQKDLSAGNWLEIKAADEFTLILRLYSTWLASGISIKSQTMPVIEKVGHCS